MTSPVKERLASIDFLRGLVIILMLVDHTRSALFSISIGSYIPENVSFGIFFTRFITHFCAPTFIFLAGLSVFLHEKRYNLNKSEIRAFLLKRGLFFIILELVLISFFWHQITHRSFYLLSAQVIWAIGISMIFLSLVKDLPISIIFIISLTLICGHNLLDNLNINNSIIWNFLHQKAVMTIIPNSLYIRSSYPLIPWLGIICFGYVLGKILFKHNFDLKLRNKIFIWGSIVFVILFVFFRFFNIYGDPNAFHFHTDFINNLKSFLNVTKYPPSLLYILITISFSSIVLALFKDSYNHNVLVRPIINFGRAPFFFYIIHLAILAGIAQFNYMTNKISIIWFISLIIAFSSYPLVKHFIKLKKLYSNKISILSYL